MVKRLNETFPKMQYDTETPVPPRKNGIPEEDNMKTFWNVKLRRLA